MFVRSPLFLVVATSVALVVGAIPGVHAAGDPITGITVQLEEASKEIVTLHVESAHGGESFSVGHFAQFDGFQIRMVLDSNAPFLQMAFAKGTLFPNAWITVFIGNSHLFLRYHLTNALISSFQVAGAGNEVPEVLFNLVFANLHRAGEGAADGLLVRAPAQALDAITLQIPGLLPGPPVPISLNSLHVGETFAVGHPVSDDAFQATMTFDKTISPLLEKAELTGEIFKSAQMTLSTASHRPYVTYQLEDVLVSSFALGGVGAVPDVDFSLTALTATAHHP